VHGPHREHHVLDKRKSYYLVKEKTEEALTQFHAQAEELAAILRKIDQLKQEIIENTRSGFLLANQFKMLKLIYLSFAVKQTMAMSFNEVRDRLNKKEEELMANADVFMAEQVGQLDMYVNSTRDKVKLLSEHTSLIS